MFKRNPKIYETQTIIKFRNCINCYFFFSFNCLAKCDDSNKKEEKKKVEEPVKVKLKEPGTGDKTTSASGTANSNGASSGSASAQKTDEKEIKETSDSPKKDGDKGFKESEKQLTRILILIFLRLKS